MFMHLSICITENNTRKRGEATNLRRNEEGGVGRVAGRRYRRGLNDFN